jgi:hypothetical protein
MGVKIADLAKAMRELDPMMRREMLRSGGRTFAWTSPELKQALQDLVTAAIKDSVGVLPTTGGWASEFDFTCTEDDGGTPCRVRVTVDVEPVEGA